MFGKKESVVSSLDDTHSLHTQNGIISIILCLYQSIVEKFSMKVKDLKSERYYQICVSGKVLI